MTIEKTTIKRRLRGTKPKFFYRLQLIGIALTGIGTQLGAIAGFPNRFVIILLTAGVVCVTIAQFPFNEFIKGKPYAGDN